MKAYGFDPTLKHHPRLDSVVEKTEGHFKYYKYAISDTNGTRPFFESIENVSGSFLNTHINVKQDTIRSYDVETVTLNKIFEILNVDYIDLLKMDIEGEEYSVLASAPDSVLRAINQMVVEFHHDIIDGLTIACTRNVVRMLKTAGFRSHTTDYVNYLFFRDAPVSSKV